MVILAAAGEAVRWRGGYGRLWSAAVLSRVGDAVRNVALPLVAAGLTTSPFLLSVVSAAGYLPWLGFGLLDGALADRVDRRRAMWTVRRRSRPMRGPRRRRAPPRGRTTRQRAGRRTAGRCRRGEPRGVSPHTSAGFRLRRPGKLRAAKGSSPQCRGRHTDAPASGRAASVTEAGETFDPWQQCRVGVSRLPVPA